MFFFPLLALFLSPSPPSESRETNSLTEGGKKKREDGEREGWSPKNKTDRQREGVRAKHREAESGGPALASTARDLQMN